MNLLPPNIIRHRQYYAIFIRMAAIQAVIFLLFILSVWVFDLVIELRETQAAGLNILLEDERFASSEAAAASLREHRIRETVQNEAVTWLELPDFNMARLDMIKGTMPSGVELIQLDMDESGAMLILQTANLSLVDIHREAWIDTGLVSRVQLISAASIKEGRIQYMLSLRWQDES